MAVTNPMRFQFKNGVAVADVECALRGNVITVYFVAFDKIAAAEIAERQVPNGLKILVNAQRNHGPSILSQPKQLGLGLGLALAPPRGVQFQCALNTV